METFVQPKVTGYRQLTEQEAVLMNEIKQHGIALGDLVAKLRATEGLDQRWVSIGATDLQEGTGHVIGRSVCFGVNAGERARSPQEPRASRQARG